MLPLNILSEIYRTLTRAIRILANRMSKAMIIATLFIITPLFFPAVMMWLGLLTGIVQAYIFSVLATSYIAAAVSTRETNT